MEKLTEVFLELISTLSDEQVEIVLDEMQKMMNE